MDSNRTTDYSKKQVINITECSTAGQQERSWTKVAIIVEARQWRHTSNRIRFCCPQHVPTLYKCKSCYTSALYCYYSTYKCVEVMREICITIGSKILQCLFVTCRFKSFIVFSSALQPEAFLGIQQTFSTTTLPPSTFPYPSPFSHLCLDLPVLLNLPRVHFMALLRILFSSILFVQNTTYSVYSLK